MNTFRISLNRTQIQMKKMVINEIELQIVDKKRKKFRKIQYHWCTISDHQPDHHNESLLCVLKPRI